MYRFYLFSPVRSVSCFIWCKTVPALGQKKRQSNVLAKRWHVRRRSENVEQRSRWRTKKGDVGMRRAFSGSWCCFCLVWDQLDEPDGREKMCRKHGIRICTCHSDEKCRQTNTHTHTHMQIELQILRAQCYRSVQTNFVQRQCRFSFPQLLIPNTDFRWS